MGKSIPAIITPEVLQWARSLDRITVDEIAQKLKVDVAKVKAWESGHEYPTLLQAKNLAKQYRVPFAYFYLPDTPLKTKRLDKIDYRTFGNWGMGGMSREMRWFLRDVEDRRDTMIELYKEAEIEPTTFTLKIPIETTEEAFAAQIRKLLSLTDKVQKKLRKPETALSYCISVLETQDFLIFQATKIQPEEMRGLSVAYDIFPIIALNRKDEPSAKLFTLLHELVHILTRTSGICNDMSQDKTQLGQMELFCNKIAGLALVPKMMEKRPENRFESFAVIRETIGKHDFLTMEISDEDRQIYQDFTNLVYASLTSYMAEPQFNTDCVSFISRLEKALSVNLFEIVIQKNSDVISGIVDCGYHYNNSVNIPTETVRKFLNWFRTSTPQSQALVLNNFISKISGITVTEPVPELPF